jgi:hypothetical protein
MKKLAIMHKDEVLTRWSKTLGGQAAAAMLLSFLALFMQPSVARADLWVAADGAIDVNGPSDFSALENSGQLTESWTIKAANDGTIATITGIAVVPGVSSDGDDLMLLTSPPLVARPANPLHPRRLRFPFNLATPDGLIILNDISRVGNPAAPVINLPSSRSFDLTFNPVDDSGINDYDSGTTPFDITITYNTFNLSTGARVRGNQLNFEVDGTTYDPVPEPGTLIAGALMLLPFGASSLRMLRKRHAA